MLPRVERIAGLELHREVTYWRSLQAIGVHASMNDVSPSTELPTLRAVREALGAAFGEPIRLRSSIPSYRAGSYRLRRALGRGQGDRWWISVDSVDPSESSYDKAKAVIDGRSRWPTRRAACEALASELPNGGPILHQTAFGPHVRDRPPSRRTGELELPTLLDE